MADNLDYRNTLKELRREQSLRAAKHRPELCFLPFCPWEMLQEIRQRHFPEVKVPVGLSFILWDMLAFVNNYEDRAEIFIHGILNHPNTPREVIRFVIKHELCHLVVHPREMDGKMTMHPPEFWELEAAVAPERRRAWCWVYLSWGEWLKRSRKRECICVRGGWKKAWAGQKLPITAIDVLYPELREVPAIEDMLAGKG